MAPITLLDAHVLYPSPSLIRNLVMHCATRSLIATHWTANIHEE